MKYLYSKYSSIFIHIFSQIFFHFDSYASKWVIPAICRLVYDFLETCFILMFQLQVKSLEYALQDKVDKLAAVSNELEKAKAESLGAYHLLGIEEERNKELEDEIDELTYKLTGKTEEIESLREKIKVLEEELDSTTKRFNSIQVISFSLPYNILPIVFYLV